MSKHDHQDVLEKLGKAKARLVLEQPFFGALVCNLKTIVDDGIFPPTACTNGTWIKYHPEFVRKLSMDETVFLICHEVLHVAFMHMSRLGERHPIKWNIATDLVINDLLRQDNIGKMPEGGLYDPALVQRGGGTAEGVYDILPAGSSSKSKDNEDGSGGFSGSYSEDNLFDKMEKPGAGDSATEGEIVAQIKVLVAQAAQVAKVQGKLSANLERFVGQVLKPKVDWREVLRNFVTAKAKVEPTFARPKRRFIDADLYLPSLSGEAMGELAVFVDCSGSITNELDQFAAEICAIKEDVRPEKIHVVYFDHGVCHYEVFGPDDELELHPHGGGGTAFEPCFDFVEEKGLELVCGVFLTDGYGSCECPPPSYPVLWVTTGTTKFPFGQVVEMKP